MKPTTKNDNPYYIYMEDVYGVNGLLDFKSKRDLTEFLNCEDFFENVEIKSISDTEKKQISEAIVLYEDNSINNIEFEEKLMDIFGNIEGFCLEKLNIEDFESLCNGESDFGKMSIEIFCEHNDYEEYSKIPEELKKEFRSFFDTATDTWVG
jgi:hypothetical protein